MGLLQILLQPRSLLGEINHIAQRQGHGGFLEHELSGPAGMRPQLSAEVSRANGQDHVAVTREVILGGFSSAGKNHLNFGGSGHIHFRPHGADAFDQFDHPMHFCCGGIRARDLQTLRPFGQDQQRVRAAFRWSRAQISSVMKGMKG